MFIDIYLGNSTRPLNIDFSRLQHPPLMSTFADIRTHRVSFVYFLLAVASLIVGTGWKDSSQQ